MAAAAYKARRHAVVRYFASSPDFGVGRLKVLPTPEIQGLLLLWQSAQRSSDPPPSPWRRSPRSRYFVLAHAAGHDLALHETARTKRLADWSRRPLERRCRAGPESALRASWCPAEPGRRRAARIDALSSRGRSIEWRGSRDPRPSAIRAAHHPDWRLGGLGRWRRNWLVRRGLFGLLLVGSRFGARIAPRSAKRQSTRPLVRTAPRLRVDG